MTLPTDIDDRERERVRQALKRYKDLHGLGAVKLTRLIEDTLKLPIDQSTLQRFLRGQHRTDDIVVHRFRLFLRRVAPPPTGDELARAFKTFLPLASAPKGGLRPFAGAYSSFRRPYAQGPAPVAARLVARIGMRSAAALWGQGFRPDFAAFTFTRGAEPGYLRVSETFGEAPAGEELSPEAWDSWLASSGILLPCGMGQFFMVMRSYLEARFYLLRVVSALPVALRGFVYEPGSMAQLAAPSVAQLASATEINTWQPSFEFVLVRKTPATGI